MGEQPRSKSKSESFVFGKVHKKVYLIKIISGSRGFWFFVHIGKIRSRCCQLAKTAEQTVDKTRGRNINSIQNNICATMMLMGVFSTSLLCNFCVAGFLSTNLTERV